MHPSKTFISIFAALICILITGGLSIKAAAQNLAQDDTGPLVITTTTSGIDIRFALNDFARFTEKLEGNPYDVLSFDGQNAVMKTPGSPELPILNLLIGVPQNGRIDLEIVSMETKLLPGTYNLAPAPQPAPLEEPLTPGKWNREPADLPSVQAAKLFPASPAVIADEAWIRGQRVMRIQFSPFQYNAADGTLAFHTDLHVDVRFSDPAAVDCQDCRYEASLENVLAQQLVNYEQSLAWRVPAGTDALLDQIQTPPHNRFLGSRIEIVIDQDGIYRLTYDDLEIEMQQAGMDPGSLNPRKLHLYNHGTEMRMLITGENDDSFDSGDAIIFYGEKFRGDIMEARYQPYMTKPGNIRNDPAYAANNWFWQCIRSCELDSYFERYTEDNVYYLVLETTDGLRMTSKDGTPGSATTPDYFYTTVRAEDDQIWWSFEFWDDEVWFWNVIQSSPYTSTHPINLPGAVAQALTASLHLEFVTESQNLTQPNDYHTRVLINGNQIADNFWDGKNRFELDQDFSQTTLLDGGNDFKFELLDNPLLIAPKLYFDFFEITYARDFNAANDQLAFRYDQPGSWHYQVTGLTSPTAEVFDITDPFNPARLTNVQMTDNGGSFAVDFEVIDAAPASYFVVGTGTGMRSPKKLAAYNPPDFSGMPPADYILVTHSDLITSTQSLADYRAGQGHSTAVIDINDLYHEFNDGILHPIAIKNFLAYAFANWPTPPVYVTLVGSGNWNIKQVGDGSKPYHNAPFSYMPPNLAYIDPWQGEVDSANLLATVIGDDTIPDVHIGRIPVSSDAQMADVVAKIIGYESAPLASWQMNNLFIADNVPDPKFAGDFVGLSESIIADYLAAHLPYQALRIYEDTGTMYPEIPDFNCTAVNTPECENVTTAIIDTLNITGTLIVNYTGHASVDRWSGEYILLPVDFERLSNGDRLPFVFSLTCLDGHWTYPFLDSISTLFLTSAGKGAIGTFSSTGLGVATGHDYLQRGFYNTFFENGNGELGAATTSAKLLLWSSGFDYDLMHTFTLFGDPAVRLPYISQAYLPFTTR